MAVEPPKEAEQSAARLPADLVTMAKTISANCDETVGEIIDSAARPAILRRYKATVEKLSRDLGGDAGGA